MREITFRGMSVEQPIRWVYGCLVNNLWTYSEHSSYPKGTSVCEIIIEEYEGDSWEDIAQQEGGCIVQVTPESVGEFTGLKDKNGNEIYEGDIVKLSPRGSKYFGQLFEVIFEAATFQLSNDGLAPIAFITIAVQCEQKGLVCSWLEVEGLCEVVGNIYENPELLNSEQNQRASVATVGDSNSKSQ